MAAPTSADVEQIDPVDDAAPVSGQGGPNRRKTMADKVWEFFISLKVTLVILILLSAAMVIGTFVPQVPQSDPQAIQALLDDLPPLARSFVQAFELLDVFHSYWFMILLVLFGLALIACSVDRLPRTWRNTFHSPRTLTARPAEAGGASAVLAANPEPERVKQVLREHFRQVEQHEQGGALHLFAERQRLVRLNYYAIHAGLLVIMVGALIHARFGFDGFVNIREGGGEASHVTIRDGELRYQYPLGFTIRCDDFEFETFADGSPRAYKSDLTLLGESGEPVANKTIVVNDPLQYQGITIYQSSYEEDRRGAVFELAVTDSETGQTSTVEVVGGDGYEIDGVRYSPIAWDDNLHGMGPAVQLERTEIESGEVSRFVVMQRFAGRDAKERDDRYHFDYLGREKVYHTGLQVAYSPAISVIWFGCFVVIFGMFVALFASHRRLWVRLGDGEVWVRGRAQKNAQQYAEEVRRIVAKLEAPDQPPAAPASGEST